MLPRLLSIMHIQPPITGDSALLELARIRLDEAGLGGELYPGSPEHINDLLSFRPTQACTAHLPRHINLLNKEGQDAVIAFAENAAGKFYGLVVHDHAYFAGRPEDVVIAFRNLDQRLGKIIDAPQLFVEYAVGLELDFFATLFEKSQALSHVSACIDIGHMGIFSCRQHFAKMFEGASVCAFRPDSVDLPDRIEAVQLAVSQSRSTVVELITRLAELGKPLHFHLHDGHPTSSLSLFGVSDHLSFLQQIQIPFLYQGRKLLNGIYSIEGLNEVVSAAMMGLSADKLSFMLELHPQPGQTPLGSYSYIFDHWVDKTNAEQMNYWLDRLIENSILLRSACNLR